MRATVQHLVGQAAAQQCARQALAGLGRRHQVLDLLDLVCSLITPPKTKTPLCIDTDTPLLKKTGAEAPVSISLSTSKLVQVVHDRIGAAYAFVRDEIAFGYNLADDLPASRVLEDGLGQCNTKGTLFMALLRHPNGIGQPLTLMHKYGILAAYLPQWNLIVGQMQFDMFHAYTVDEHTHRLLQNIHRFPNPASRQTHPLCHEVFTQLRKPELLSIAALFHDIAKGRRGDHSELGAVDALEFCQLHGLDRYESRLVAWLVRTGTAF